MGEAIKIKKSKREHKKRRPSDWQLNRKGLFSISLNAKIILIFSLLFIFVFSALQKDIKAQNRSKAKLFLSPPVGSFLVGSTFDMSIIVDTDNALINTVGASLKFPTDKLQIVKPTTGKSFVSVWFEQPTYSNTEGTISFVGGIPDGINTSSGFVSTVTFRVIAAGEAVVEFLPSSKVLAHDGKGTNILSELGKAIYTIKPKPPEGPKVFSETHLYKSRWYNNNNPIISWEKEAGVTDFSFSLDNYPQSVPDNNSDTQETTKAFENLADGLWYFHIKAKKENVWGVPSHYLLRIDTTPPAPFRPKVDFLTATIIGRVFVSFSTRDALSGISHYEVAAIDRTAPPLGAPVFIEAESPYQLPKFISGNLRIIIRAIDKAGNVRDESLDADFPESLISLIKNNITLILSVALALTLISHIINFLSKRKVFTRFRRIKRDNQEGLQ